jgi:hypothetical protein
LPQTILGREKFRRGRARGQSSRLVRIEVSLLVAHQITARIGSRIESQIEWISAPKPWGEMRIEFAGFCLARAVFG